MVAEPSRWEVLRDRQTRLRSELLVVENEMDVIEREYLDRHPEITEDEFEALLKRAAP